MRDHAADTQVTDVLVPVVYDELKRIARHYLRVAQEGATLCTTELVHEAFLKLARRRDLHWQSRAHFFGTASRAMRQVLTDFARRRAAAKRGAGWRRVSLNDADRMLQLEIEEMLALDAALDRLNGLNRRLRQVVELRFFGGVAEQEVAEMLGVSTRTVERDWLKARLFLLEELDSPHRTGERPEE